jgi:hypothetical protein
MSDRFSESYLKDRGVTLTDEKRLILHCDSCGQGWSPNIQRGGKIKRGFWYCPNGCNRPDKRPSL